MSAPEQPLGVLEMGMLVVVVAGLVAVFVVVAGLAAGAYIGWHALGPWLAK